jgi:hypothetical protein
MDARTFEEWLEALRRAWEGRDPEAAAHLFTEDATYQETPLDEPMTGRAAIRAYWEAVPTSQRQIKFDSDVLAFTGPGEGLARWRASFVRVSSRVLVELDGNLLVRLVGGQCADFREWWHRREGTAAPSPTGQPPRNGATHQALQQTCHANEECRASAPSRVSRLLSGVVRRCGGNS